MAGWNGISIAPLTATGTALKTLLQVVAPAATDLVVREASISFDGVTATDVPITVELTTTDGDGTGTTLTPAAVCDDRRTSNTCAATAKYGFSAEPNNPVVLRRWKIHPQGGALLYSLPLGQPVTINRGKGVALRVTAGVSVNAAAQLAFEE